MGAEQPLPGTAIISIWALRSVTFTGSSEWREQTIYVEEKVLLEYHVTNGDQSLLDSVIEPFLRGQPLNQWRRNTTHQRTPQKSFELTDEGSSTLLRSWLKTLKLLGFAQYNQWSSTRLPSWIGEASLQINSKKKLELLINLSFGSVFFFQ